jgi:anti-sigma regulatory factor (Ser/Thr protein kinase)
VSASPLRFPADPAQLRAVRAGVRAAAAELGAGSDACDALALVVDELVNNAIEHGSSYRTPSHELGVQVGFEGGHVTLDFFDPDMPDPQVVDLDRALREAADGMPALESERGRGLFLISIYLEELHVAVAVSGGLHLRGRLAAS